MRIRAPRSLKARLLCFLLAAIVLTAATQAVVAYRAARADAEAVFDDHLQQMAGALRNGLPAASSAAASGPPQSAGQAADFVVQVWTADGLQAFRSADTQLPKDGAPGFSEIPADGTTYRVFSLHLRSQTIQIAQNMVPRRAKAARLALRAVVPIAVMAPLLMLLVWWVVNRSMAPVARAGSELARRRADDSTEISESGLPEEIQPLIHELNLLFARVARAFQAQKSFVADAAHELRSPLAALKLQVQGLRSAGSESAREIAVARLTAGVDRATRLVEQLLTLARQEACADGARTETVTLADIVREEVVDAAPAAQARELDLGLTRADAGSVAGQPEALRILVRNLVDNALKYTPPGGKVDVEVRREADRLVLGVDDSGPGIAAADRARVLDRFFRVEGSQGTGSGLGLAIVHAIAELHAAPLTLGRSPSLGGLRVTLSFLGRD